MEHDTTPAGTFSFYALGPSKTLSNVSITNGVTNSIAATLTASPSASVPLHIAGGVWVGLARSVGPGTPPVISDYSAFAQPYVTDRHALAANGLIAPGPDFSMLGPSAQPTTPPIISPPVCLCSLSTLPLGFPIPNNNLPSSTTDQDYGTVPYGDPFPPVWPRLFQYWQISSMSVPRPNSSATDTFIATNKQTTGC